MVERVGAIVTLYITILILEGSAFLVFPYLVTKKTTGATCRRWKASLVCAVGWIISIRSFFFVFCIFLISVDLINPLIIDPVLPVFASLLLIFLGLDVVIFIPLIIIGTFVAYAHFLQTGDRFIENYWENPEINYARFRKPPLLKM
jgi:hypothetical protein